MENKRNNFWQLISVIVIIVIVFSGTLVMSNRGMMANWFGGNNMHDNMSMDEHRLVFLDHRDEIVQDLIIEGNYACCLEKPCTYCVEKTPGHGEGATCHCLDDIINGKHPCGECIGEILEGHGNKYISKYFATAIAEEVGLDHLDTIKQIITEKYNISLDEQI